MRVSIVVCMLTALVAASAASAGQPVEQTLTPPPPSFETCKAMGNGTICEGMVSNEVHAPYDTGIACPSFDVFDSGVHQEVAKRTYDADGNLVTRVRHDLDHGQFTRPGSPILLPYSQSQEWTDVLAVPGDFASSTLTMTGGMVLHLPQGRELLVGAGRVVFGPSAIEFQAGPTGFLDLVFEAPSAIDVVCGALAGASS
jgi:hypothetical protein